ncbi:hypothetical protein ABZ215_23950 [Amycolatopsis sp. NPDC006131]|uniref:hypothetical protein n=1 Tax=Amycolatopsis sp. NPDC006131 TaxID=3156731 RepID=UPI0033B66CC5
MASWLYGIAVLACPVGMGLMMWMMGRRGDADTQQVAQLREEINELKAERARRRVDQVS